MSPTFAENLISKISAEFSKYYKDWVKEDYLSAPYSSNFSKDPFKDNMDTIKDMDMQIRVAWTQYVMKSLQQHSCTSLSKDKVWTILYYFSPEFRNEISHSMKMWASIFSDDNFYVDSKEIKDYCTQYFYCWDFNMEKRNYDMEMSSEYQNFKNEDEDFQNYNKKLAQYNADKKEIDAEWAKYEQDLAAYNELKNKYVKNGIVVDKEWYNSNVRPMKKTLEEKKDTYKQKDKELEKRLKSLNEEKAKIDKKFKKELQDLEDKQLNEHISANTPDVILKNCEEFFVSEYEKWKEDQTRVQNLQKSQLWADKYWNNTTDDSPYDIMIDINTIAELMYKEAETPTTPVYYHTPNFYNSEKKLLALKDAVSPANVRWNTSSDTSQKSKNWNNNSSKWLQNQWNQNKQWNVLLPSLSEDIQDFVNPSSNSSGNGGLLDNKNGIKNLFYWTSCVSNDVEDKLLDEEMSSPVEKDNKNLEDFTEEEYADLIDSMVDAVDNFDTLWEAKEQEIKSDKESKNIDTQIFESKNADEIKKLADDIKSCWSKCDGLRIDQKASCYVMCACWEYESEVFDPDKFPGLWPIFTIKFCAVPGVNYDFSVWGKKIVSIEEWINEIYWVVDKLAREWKLGTWVPQHNFLDSTTKNMNFSETFTFTISQEYVDPSLKKRESNDEYKDLTIEEQNQKDMEFYEISNPLDNPNWLNRYVVIWSKNVEWFDTISNAQAVVDKNKESNWDSKWWFETDRNTRYSQLSDIISNWKDNQLSFRESLETYITGWWATAESLYNKRSNAWK